MRSVTTKLCIIFCSPIKGMILPYFPEQSQPVLWVTCPWILQNLLHPLKNQAMKYCSKDIFWFQITNSKREAWLYGQNSKKIRGNFVSLCSGWFTSHNICLSLLWSIEDFAYPVKDLLMSFSIPNFYWRKIHLFIYFLTFRKFYIILLEVFLVLFFMKVSSL